jgi:hypothetical protein
MFKLLRCKTCTIQRGTTMAFCMMIIPKGQTTLNNAVFVKHYKPEREWRLEFDIHILFHAENP